MANSSNEIGSVVLVTASSVGQWVELPPSILNSKLGGALESQ